MGSERFEVFYGELIGRHQTRITHLLSTAGDAVMVGGVVLGAAARRPTFAMRGVIVGFSIAAVAHLFQPGSLGEELREIARHPVWTLRAESRRVRSLSPAAA